MDGFEAATAPDSHDLEDSLQRGFRYALSLTHDASEAEDLVQNAVTTMLTKGTSWERSYLFATIRNRFIDSYRRKQTLKFVSIEDEGDAVIGSGSDRASWPDSFDCLETGLLQEALGCLRADEREALFLAVVEGYTAEEIARLSDRPRGTVLSLLFRAKKKLRAKLTAARNPAAGSLARGVA